jgi:hypothetical protein
MSFTNEQSRLRSIFQFLGTCSIPLITDFGDMVRILGTGTLFGAVGKHFLITALHVLRDFDPNDDLYGLSGLEWNDVGLPLTRQADGNRNVWTIPKGELQLPTDDLYDVAIVEIQDKDLVQKLKSTWHFMSPSNIDAVSVPSDEDRYIMVGYPNPRIDLTMKAGERFDSKLFCNITRKFRGSLDNLNMKIPLDERVDLLLEHPDKFLSADGTTGDMPDLGGASGCSVWRLGTAGGYDSEDPQSHIKLVATFSSVIADPDGVAPEPPFERAKLAHVLWNIFRKTHPDVAAAIQSAQASRKVA